MKQVKRVYVCSEPVNMCKQFDGLIALATEFLGGKDPEGNVFVFRNKLGDRLKLLYWDHEGVIIWYKRYADGRLAPAFRDVSLKELRLGLREVAALLEGAPLALRPPAAA